MAFAHFARDKILSAEKGVGLLDFTLFYVLLYKRGRYLFTVYHNVLYGHIPHAVFLVFGIVFERGRLALGACAEAEVLAAHIGLDVYVLFKVVQKICRGSLFELVCVVDFKYEFGIVARKKSQPFFKSENLPAALTFGKHHYAEVETVYLCLKFCLLQKFGVAHVYGVETAEHHEGREIVLFFVVIDYF